MPVSNLVLSIFSLCFFKAYLNVSLSLILFTSGHHREEAIEEVTTIVEATMVTVVVMMEREEAAAAVTRITTAGVRSISI